MISSSGWYGSVIEHGLMNEEVAGLISNQGTCQVCSIPKRIMQSMDVSLFCLSLVCVSLLSSLFKIKNTKLKRKRISVFQAS